MAENTNKAIAINSIINYAKMGINTILALFTTRFALQALGVIDYGLFSVLGSIISFIGIFNASMLSTCNRFIAVAIGRGDSAEINKQFNVNLVIFIVLAVMMTVIAFPLGEWYVHTKSLHNTFKLLLCIFPWFNLPSIWVFLEHLTDGPFTHFLREVPPIITYVFFHSGRKFFFIIKSHTYI